MNILIVGALGEIGHILHNYFTKDGSYNVVGLVTKDSLKHYQQFYKEYNKYVEIKNLTFCSVIDDSLITKTIFHAVIFAHGYTKENQLETQNINNYFETVDKVLSYVPADCTIISIHPVDLNKYMTKDEPCDYRSKYRTAHKAITDKIFKDYIQSREKIGISLDHPMYYLLFIITFINYSPTNIQIK